MSENKVDVAAVENAYLEWVRTRDMPPNPGIRVNFNHRDTIDSVQRMNLQMQELAEALRRLDVAVRERRVTRAQAQAMVGAPERNLR